MPSDAEHYWVCRSSSEMFRTHSHVHALKQQTRRPIYIYPHSLILFFAVPACYIYMFDKDLIMSCVLAHIHEITIISSSRLYADYVSKVLDIEGIQGKMYLFVVYR